VRIKQETKGWTAESSGVWDAGCSDDHTLCGENDRAINVNPSVLPFTYFNYATRWTLCDQIAGDGNFHREFGGRNGTGRKSLRLRRRQLSD
jgi:hypothetical protein